MDCAREDAGRLAEFGKQIRRGFGAAIPETRGEGADLELSLTTSGRIDHVVLRAEIGRSQRIRSYVVEGQKRDGE